MGEPVDQLLRFTFEHLNVRGELVQLGASWRAIRENQAYPAVVASELGQGIAAVALLSGTIKFQGSLILQAQGSGPLPLVLAQATDQRTVRGLARWQPEVVDAAPSALYRNGRLVITAQAPDNERYQGIVALDADHLAHALETYFAQSEQLPTRLWLSADGERAAGLFLQRLPGESADPDGWERVCLLADTVREAELRQLAPEALLFRLFHEETVRTFEPEPVAYRCGCSREQTGDMLRALGPEEAGEVVREEGEIRVDCEFCGRSYRFDPVDVAALFAPGGSTLPGDGSQH